MTHETALLQHAEKIGILSGQVEGLSSELDSAKLKIEETASTLSTNTGKLDASLEMLKLSIAQQKEINDNIDTMTSKMREIDEIIKDPEGGIQTINVFKRKILTLVFWATGVCFVILMFSVIKDINFPETIGVELNENSPYGSNYTRDTGMRSK